METLDSRTRAEASHRFAAATPWRRMMAITYESIILFGVIWFADYAFSAVTQFRGEPGPLRTAFQTFTTLVLAGYFGFFWSRGRHSLPMKTIGVRVLTADDQPLSLGRALLRFAAALSMPIAVLAAGTYGSGWFFLALPLPWVWCLIDRDHQSLYDRVARTRLVHDPRPVATRSVDV
ncbi:MAG: RDD family protein [Betaproteobacteria bacterium]|nr:RDD family protein [Betaproteobacteria bacterium]